MASTTPIVLAALAVLAALLYTLDPLCPTFVSHDRGMVLVTGSSSGIGRDFAIALAKTTNFTVLAGVRKTKDAQALQDLGIKSLRPIILDVTNDDHVKDAVATVRKLSAESATPLPFVGLVNNAGISYKMVVEGQDLERAKQVYDVNVYGIYRLSKAFASMLRASKGRIINVGSMAGVAHTPGRSVYSATKAAERAITNVMRRELQDFGVAVSTVDPGYVKTAIADKPISGDIKSQVDESVYEAYKPWFDSVADHRRSNFATHADTTDVTTAALMHALTSPKPRTRYPCATVDKGVPAWLLDYVFWLAPDRVDDLLIRFSSGPTANVDA